MANSNPSVAWDQFHSGLWLQIMTGNKVLSGERAHSGHMVQCASGLQAVPRLWEGQSVQSQLMCWEYNSLGVCNCKSCGYKHECSACSGTHSVTVYPHNKNHHFW